MSTVSIIRNTMASGDVVHIVAGWDDRGLWRSLSEQSGRLGRENALKVGREMAEQYGAVFIPCVCEMSAAHRDAELGD